jgi:hypothetical protein
MTEVRVIHIEWLFVEKRIAGDPFSDGRHCSPIRIYKPYSTKGSLYDLFLENGLFSSISICSITRRHSGPKSRAVYPNMFLDSRPKWRWYAKLNGWSQILFTRTTHANKHYSIMQHSNYTRNPCKMFYGVFEQHQIEFLVIRWRLGIVFLHQLREPQIQTAEWRHLEIKYLICFIKKSTGGTNVNDKLLLV